MSIQKRIDELNAAADKLRPLDDDDPKKGPLTAMVDEINALRAKQGSEGFVDELDIEEVEAQEREKVAAETAERERKSAEAKEAQRVKDDAELAEMERKEATDKAGKGKGK